MTMEQWAALGADEPGEWVDGFLVEEEMPDATHEAVIAWLIWTLRSWIGTTGAFVFGSGLKTRVTPWRGRMPDLCVYFRGDDLPRKRGLVVVPPSIAVEVVSPTARDARRDRIEKMAEYAEFGIRWYWLVDPEKRTFELFELGPDHRYVHALGASEGVIARVPGCEGLQLDLSALWAEIDALPEGEGPA
jgi:Uma2 family endonuclease